MNHRDERLGSAPLGKLMFSLAVPSVAAQLINVLYNIVDRIYIGDIPGYGDVALTGVGVTFPILTMISAFSAFAGMGGAPLASIQLGKKNKQGAEQILGNSAGLLIIFSVILTAFFSICKTPILYAFGASDATIVYARDYISIYLIGTIFVQLALGLNAYISGQGEAKTAMLSVLIGAVLNICLDPVFIFVLHLGVRGAAIATILSQAVSAAWVVHFLTSEKTVMHLSLKNMRLRADVIKMIAGLGISPFIMQSTESFVTITLNTGLQRYGGDLYVGSMSILMSIMQLITIPVQGITQGIQPIISYNYGAGNAGRVKSAFKLLLKVSLCYSTILWGAVMLFPEVFAGMFTTEADLIVFTRPALRIYMAVMLIFGIQMACQMTFNALGRAVESIVVAVMRKFILLLPLIYIMTLLFSSNKTMAVYLAEPAADLLAVTFTAILFTVRFKKALQTMENKKIQDT